MRYFKLHRFRENASAPENRNASRRAVSSSVSSHEPSIVGGNASSSKPPARASASSTGNRSAFPARVAPWQNALSSRSTPASIMAIASSGALTPATCTGLCRGNSETHASTSARRAAPGASLVPKPPTEKPNASASFVVPPPAPRNDAAALALARRASTSHPPCTEANIAMGTTFVSFSSFVTFSRASFIAAHVSIHASVRSAAARVFLAGAPSTLCRSSASDTNACGCVACTHRMYSSTEIFFTPTGVPTNTELASLEGLACASNVMASRAVASANVGALPKYARPPPGQLETCEGGRWSMKCTIDTWNARASGGSVASTSGVRCAGSPRRVYVRHAGVAMRTGSSRPSPAPGTDSTPSRGPAVDARSPSPTTVHVNSRIAAGGEASSGEGGGGGSAEKRPPTSVLREFVSADSRRLVRNLTTMTSPSCHTSARTGGAPRPRESLAAMEELQKVRCRARRARSSGSRSATPPVPGRSSRAFALTRDARLPSRDSRRADPPACPLPRRRSASAWSRCARWASASSKRFVKRASSLPRRGRNGRVLSADAKAGDGHPSPSSRSSIFASRRLATDVVPQIS